MRTHLKFLLIVVVMGGAIVLSLGDALAQPDPFKKKTIKKLKFLDPEPKKIQTPLAVEKAQKEALDRALRSLKKMRFSASGFQLHAKFNSPIADGTSKGNYIFPVTIISATSAFNLNQQGDNNSDYFDSFVSNFKFPQTGNQPGTATLLVGRSTFLNLRGWRIAGTLTFAPSKTTFAGTFSSTTQGLPIIFAVTGEP